MSDDVLVKAEGVSKKFCRSLKRSLWYGVRDVGSELLGSKSHHDELRKNEFWAVDDVSFELKRGECLGLIGLNGAGKSTLLKMLNGLVKPDMGRIAMRGRVGALIELGAGFNPILTARENIYVNGSVLGLSRKEIDSKFAEIVEFSGISDFLDTPVQNFSSGMKVRLGFSIAAQFEPDILVIDEVLAVGDASFRLKCMNRISEISRDSAVILVSHSMPMISRMASNVLLMSNGSVEYLGQNVQKGIEKYLSFVIPPDTEEQSEFFKLEKFKISVDRSGESVDAEQINFSDDLSIEMHFKSYEWTGRFLVNVSFLDMENKMVAQCFSYYSDFVVNCSSKQFAIQLDLLRFNLNPGRYSIQVDLVEALDSHRRGMILYKNRSVQVISVIGNLTGWAPVQIVGNWKQLAEGDSKSQ